MSIEDDLAVVRRGLGIRTTDSASPERRRKREQHEALDRVEAVVRSGEGTAYCGDCAAGVEGGGEPKDGAP